MNLTVGSYDPSGRGRKMGKVQKSPVVPFDHASQDSKVVLFGDPKDFIGEWAWNGLSIVAYKGMYAIARDTGLRKTDKMDPFC